MADPRTLPRLDTSKITRLGQIQLPDGWIWGDHAMCVEGDQMTVAIDTDRAGVIQIPPIGSKATVIVDGPYRFPLDKVKPGAANGFLVGGLLRTPGAVHMSAWAYYTFEPDEIATHFSAASLAGLQAATPVKLGQTRPAMVSGPMGLIPAEWQTLLGGTALAMQGCIPIISRSSLGPSVAAFTPGNWGTSRWLVGYPIDHPTLGTWEANPPGQYYGASDQIGAVFIVPGTRTLAVVGRHGMTNCYGTGAECSDPTDPNKGNHGFPYESRLTLFDLAEVLLAANPWDVKPYASFPLPGMPTTTTNMHRGGWYDPATSRLYVATTDSSRIDVFDVPSAGGGAPVDCDGTWSAWSRVAGSEGPCVGGQRTYTESRTFTVTTHPANGGKACPVSPETRTATEGCTVDIPNTLGCTVTSVSRYADGDLRLTVRANDNGQVTIPKGFTFDLTVPKG